MRLFFLLSFLFLVDLRAEQSQRNCLILLDYDDYENLGHSDSWYLTSRLQSAIAEQSIPILISSNLWNSFIERRINFEQSLQHKQSSLCKTYDLYQSINDRLDYWSRYYNNMRSDIVQNKQLVVQHINQEFYHDHYFVSDGDYQQLLAYLTHFDANNWDIYKNNEGFYLLIPKKYSSQYSSTGFNLNSLEKVLFPEDISYNFFENTKPGNFVDCLSDFFQIYNDVSIPDKLSWNIILVGHGGLKYRTSNKNNSFSRIGQPIIADLTVTEFKDTLSFFQSRVKTHLFHYSSCYAGGVNIPLIFANNPKEPYNFAIICDTLTDCISYCKWATLLPSNMKKFLKTSDVSYDFVKNCWQLPLKHAYFWKKFSEEISNIDFSIGSIECLQEIMPLITSSVIANIPMLCLPETNEFFPLQSSNTFKIDDQLLDFCKKNKTFVRINSVKTILIESCFVNSSIVIDQIEQFRMISIQPGDAVHYINTLKASYYVDLLSAFWQAQFQLFNKTFLIDECNFPNSTDALIFKDISGSNDDLTLKNVIIFQKKSCSIRLFFTIQDQAIMVVAHKTDRDEDNETATIQEIVCLSEVARKKYEEYYLQLKEQLNFPEIYK